MNKKYICSVCGHIFESTDAEPVCPVCHAKGDKIKEYVAPATDDYTFATVHTLGSAYDDKVSPELVQHCKDTFAGECSEVGMYLAMARQADREGYPEVARAFEHYAYEEANHASRYAELLGEVLKDTKTNLEMRIAAERGACEEKFEMAKKAKQEGSDALHDTIHEMAKDEARHAAGFTGLYNRYFKK